jgi:hypothetical protein
LVGGQPFNADEVIRQFARIDEVRDQFSFDFIDLFRREQLHASDHGQQGVNVVDDHGPTPLGGIGYGRQ